MSGWSPGCDHSHLLPVDCGHSHLPPVDCGHSHLLPIDCDHSHLLPASAAHFPRCALDGSCGHLHWLVHPRGANSSGYTRRSFGGQRKWEGPLLGRRSQPHDVIHLHLLPSPPAHKHIGHKGALPGDVMTTPISLACTYTIIYRGSPSDVIKITPTSSQVHRAV